MGVVYSVTDRYSFVRVPNWVNEAKRFAPEARVVLIGCKIDVIRQREVSYCEGAETAGKLRVPFLETSAKTPTNVQQTFLMLAAKEGLRAD